MGNENCLVGIKCPKCGNESSFQIAVTALANNVTDDGSDGEFTEIEWDDTSFCRCPECGYEAKVGDFKVTSKTADGSKVARLHPKCVCSKCGSDNVRRDAYAEQNPETGVWELGPVFDQAYCDKCGETTLKEAEG